MLALQSSHIVALRFGCRERLNGQWGPLDAKDSVEAVRQLGERGLVDAKRAAVRGGSAGGFATWVNITEYPNSFASATVLCGVADMRTLRLRMHKFESHYLDTLIGATLDDDPELWKDRSPITKAQNVRVPLLVSLRRRDFMEVKFTVGI